MVRAIAVEHRMDVLVLAEAGKIRIKGFYDRPGATAALRIFTRAPELLAEPCSEGSYFSIRRVFARGRPEVLLATVHLPSKLYWSSESQHAECTTLSHRIRDVERMASHSRTILVGDFNMNPFEAGMLSATALHGVPSRQIAGKGSRTVLGAEHPFFYNPMWNHFGDIAGPAGSYYYASAQHVNCFWNVFDQVLVRPELLEGFDPRSTRILTEGGGRSLIRPDGQPDATNFSDHLPLLFEVKF